MGLGDFVSGLLGSKNKAKAANPTVDPNAYQYGGRPGGAAAMAGHYRGIADQAQTRGAEQANTGETAWDRQAAYGARMGQQGMAQMMDARARGLVPSIAQMQADRQMQQATAAQASQAASARGAGGLALAQQGAANNVANAHADISGQAQINAAQERAAAEQAAFGAYSGMRGGDQQQGQMAAQTAQFQAQMNAAQRAQNDTVSAGYAQLENNVNQSQLGAQMNQQAQQSANSLGASGINAGVGGQNAAMNQQNGWGAIGMGRDAFGAAGSLFGGKKADGGPTAGGRAYLVGEEGPELIVPREDGHVMTAEQTARVLAKAGMAPKGAHVFGGARMGGGMVSGVGGGIDMGNSLGMSADMVNAASTGMMAPGGIAGMVGGGGITGGNVDIGGMGYGGGRAEGGPVQGYAPSTWGSGGPDTAAQSMALMTAARQAQGTQQAAQQAQSIESPWARDVRQVQMLRRVNPELVNEEDDARERRGMVVMGMAKQDAAKAKAEDKPKPEAKGEAAAKPAKERDTLDRMADAKVPQYQSMGGYVAPQFIQLPTFAGAREDGGPVEGPRTPVVADRQGQAQMTDAQRKAFDDGVRYAAQVTSPQQDAGKFLPQYMTAEPGPTLTVVSPPMAASIDPNAHGEVPPPEEPLPGPQDGVVHFNRRAGRDMQRGMIDPDTAMGGGAVPKGIAAMFLRGNGAKAIAAMRAKK